MRKTGEKNPSLFPKILICGIGNRLRRDDGVGPHVTDKLREKKLPENVTVLDFGISGFKTVLHIGDYDRVIFVDAVERGDEPGGISRTTLGGKEFSESRSLNAFSLSLHESDLEKILSTAALLESYPGEVVLIGCKPEDLSWGVGLSQNVEKTVGNIIDLVLAEIA